MAHTVSYPHYNNTTMDILKQFTPEQLKALSAEQIRAIMGAAVVSDSDMAYLKLFIRGISGGYDSFNYREDLNRFREILLKYPKYKFYIVTKYTRWVSNDGETYFQFPIDIMGEDEMRARCPHIDCLADMPLNTHIPPGASSIGQMIYGITNVYRVESQKLDMYDHLVKGGVIGRTDG